MSIITPSLDIVIVNWNAGDLLRDCIESIANADKETIELASVVVVDNASTDGSADLLGGQGLSLQVLHNDRNLGFAKACNQGARAGHAEFVLFLNPDTRLFGSTLTTALQFMVSPDHREIGICGVQLLDENDGVARTCSRFPSLRGYLLEMAGLDRLSPASFRGQFMREWSHEDSREVDQVMGAFFLIRRELFETLRGFDERFFVYFEEVDLSYRARAQGYSSYYLAAAQAFHKGCGTSEQVKAKRLFYNLRSRILYAFKHFGSAKAAVLLVATLVPEALARLVLAACRLSPSQAKETMGAYGKLWLDIGNMLRTHWGSKPAPKETG